LGARGAILIQERIKKAAAHGCNIVG